MILYLAFIIPVLCAIILFVFFKHKTKIWEVLIPFVFTIIFILVAKAIAISSLTDDVEYLGGIILEARYYEKWDEWIEQTCTRECCCKRDSKGNETCSTESYDCSYLQTHNAYWVVITTIGEYEVSSSEYARLIRKFEMQPQFTDMHRDFKNIDGDMYHVNWDGSDEKLDPFVTTHTYENRPKVSSSLYHFEEVDTFDLKEYKPFNYPPVIEHKQNVIIGYNDKQAERALQIVNSRLGKEKQVRAFFLVFKNQPVQAATIQQRYWEGGNKNELNVCIGIDDNEHIKWVYVFSWTEQEAVKINIRKHIEESAQFNLSEYVEFTKSEIQKNWVRKSFKDFNYLTIEPTMTQVTWIYVLTLIINIGICVWVVMNEFNDEPKMRTRWR